MSPPSNAETRRYSTWSTCLAFITFPVVYPCLVIYDLSASAYRKTPRYKRRKAEKERKMEEKGMLEGLRQQIELDERRAQERIAPQKLERPRRLSIYAASVSEPTLDAHPQEKSLLLRLPYELRLAIYEEVIGKRPIHVMLEADGALHSFRCLDDIPGKSCLTDHCGSRCHSALLAPYFRKTGWPDMKIEILPLMQTCRLLFVYQTDTLRHATLTITIIGTQSLHRWYILRRRSFSPTGRLPLASLVPF